MFTPRIKSELDDTVEPGRLEIGLIRSGYVETHVVDGHTQRVHWVVKNTKCVVPVKLIGGRADETFNHCTLRVAVHYAMPGAPPLLLPAAEQQQPFQMYQQISVDGRESICDFRFRILSSQHRNAKFLLRFWLERISDNTAVPGVEVMSEAFSFVSKKRQIELKRADLLEHEKRGSRKRASGDDGDDADAGDDEDDVPLTEREEDDELADAPFFSSSAATEVPKRKALKTVKPALVSQIVGGGIGSSAINSGSSSKKYKVDSGAAGSAGEPRFMMADERIRKDDRPPLSMYGGPPGSAFGGLTASGAGSSGSGAGGGGAIGSGSGSRQVVVIDQSLHERVDTVERLLMEQRNVLDRVLQSVLRIVPGGAGAPVGSSGAPGSDAAAAEAIAQLSLPPTPMTSIPDLAALQWYLNQHADNGRLAAEPAMATAFLEFARAFAATPQHERAAGFRRISEKAEPGRVKEVLVGLATAEAAADNKT